MNELLYRVLYNGKKVMRNCKFYCRKGIVRFKHREMKEKTTISYNKAVQLLSDIYSKNDIDFDEECKRSKTIDYDVSIIVPVYNAEKNIESCLKTVLEQKTNYTYEIICVNDGSTDSSLEILEKLSGTTNKLTVINQRNSGASVARNAGMKIAKGRYFFFVDSDDMLPANAIELLIKKALKTNADIIQGSIAKCNVDGRVYYVNAVKNEMSDNLLEYYNCNMIGTAWGRLYKREMWDGINFFEGYAYEDAIVWCNVYLKCKKMAFVPQVTYIFRSSDNSLFKRQNNSVKCLDSIWIIEECINLCNAQKLNTSTEWYQMILWQLSVGIVTRISYISNDEILQAAFVVAKRIAENLKEYRHSEFKGKNKDIYLNIENSFASSEYKKWLEYSWILSYSESI